MLDDSFEIGVDGGLLRGSVVGLGDAVLLLHGGPGLPWTYLKPLVDEISDGYQVAVYQQRGLPPSTAGAPFDVPTQVADVVAVLDGLGWDRAVVIGHSWGGHLLLHLLAAHPERLAAAMVIEPLGGVGDGGQAEFEAELIRRTPAKDVERLEELDRQSADGHPTDAEAVESVQLVWPAYFATRAEAPPCPDLQMSVEAHLATYASLHTELPYLAGRLEGLSVPTLFVHGSGSPMPVTTSTDTAQAIGPAAAVQVLDGVGHFPWLDRPGAVRAALDRLVNG
ncbi:MAG: alpha/beta hydrolase [Dermatophilaceae bacterium]